MSPSLMIHAGSYAYSCLICYDCKHFKMFFTVFNICSYINGLCCEGHGQKNNLLQFMSSRLF